MSRTRSHSMCCRCAPRSTAQPVRMSSPPPRATPSPSSFPPRRSSDLDAAYLTGAANNFLMALGRAAGATGVALLDVSTGRARSEEHTSELQSRLHLVCRLLLEKKKKRPTAVRLAAAHQLLDISDAVES